MFVTASRASSQRRTDDLVDKELGVSRQTLERWRAWWRETFVEGGFWKAAKAGVLAGGPWPGPRRRARTTTSTGHRTPDTGHRTSVRRVIPAA
jgi:hypothetical protein